MINTVEAFHKVVGHIHRDINPSNFRVKNGEVYLTGFGNVTKYIEDGEHIEESFSKFVG